MRKFNRFTEAIDTLASELERSKDFAFVAAVENRASTIDGFVEVDVEGLKRDLGIEDYDEIAEELEFIARHIHPEKAIKAFLAKYRVIKIGENPHPFQEQLHRAIEGEEIAIIFNSGCRYKMFPMTEIHDCKYDFIDGTEEGAEPPFRESGEDGS